MSAPVSSSSAPAAAAATRAFTFRRRFPARFVPRLAPIALAGGIASSLTAVAPPLSSIAGIAPFVATTAAAAVAGTASPAHAQAAKSPPEASVAAPMKDLGVIGVGTDPIVEFAIRNNGAQPLTLHVERPPASLRVVSADATIAPKGRGTVRVQVSTFESDEKPEWPVTITTNDPLHPTLTLTVRAQVRAFLSLTPPQARFSFVQFGKEGGTAHLLWAADDSTMDVLGVDSPFPFITATVREATAEERDPEVASKRQWRIALTIRGNAPVGPIADYVIVRTTHPKQPRTFLPVSGFVRPLFAVTPTTVNLNDVRASAVGTAPLVSLVVKNFGEAPLSLTETVSDLAGLEAKVIEVQAGHHWRVELRMSATAAAPGPFTGTLRIKTNSTHIPELVVPVQGTRLHDVAR